jgi:ketosteroid isomerase-like protein
LRTANRSDANLALARQLFAWFADNDVQRLTSALAPDVEARPSIHGAPVLRGREAVGAWWRSAVGTGNSLEVRPLEFEPHGDCVLVRGYLRHHHARTLSENQVHWLFEIRDGQIARMESHPTRQSALDAV